MKLYCRSFANLNSYACLVFYILNVVKLQSIERDIERVLHIMLACLTECVCPSIRTFVGLFKHWCLPYVAFEENSMQFTNTHLDMYTQIPICVNVCV